MEPLRDATSIRGIEIIVRMPSKSLLPFQMISPSIPEDQIRPHHATQEGSLLGLLALLPSSLEKHARNPISSFPLPRSVTFYNGHKLTGAQRRRRAHNLCVPSDHRILGIGIGPSFSQLELEHASSYYQIVSERLLQ